MPIFDTVERKVNATFEIINKNFVLESVRVLNENYLKIVQISYTRSHDIMYFNIIKIFKLIENM